MEVLRRAGYLVRVSTGPLALPEPVMVVLPYSEALMLEAIRGQRGVTRPGLRRVLGLSKGPVDRRVMMLKRGGHIEEQRDDYEEFGRLYPAHDKPLGKVRAREWTRFR